MFRARDLMRSRAGTCHSRTAKRASHPERSIQTHTSAKKSSMTKMIEIVEASCCAETSSGREAEMRKPVADASQASCAAAAAGRSMQIGSVQGTVSNNGSTQGAPPYATGNNISRLRVMFPLRSPEEFETSAVKFPHGPTRQSIAHLPVLHASGASLHRSPRQNGSMLGPDTASRHSHCPP